MDKYEYKLKLDQMKALAADGNYNTAAEIADSINWRKVKNVNLLMKAGDIYSKTGRYDEARDVYLMAYDRSPIGRMIIYRLAGLAVKMQNFDEAEEYYDEFVEIAPHDNLKYVLRYKISKAKGSDYQTQIGILEELKEVEYTEEWAYELAHLYHQAGESSKCIEACDELILWFGDGIYVERALELKMLYQPLTKSQEDKYRSFKQKKGNVKEVYPYEDGATQITIPPVQENTDKFNTMNLQAELAKSMQQIMEATEKETVTDTMDNIKKMVEEIPYLQVPRETGEIILEEAEAAEEEINASLRMNFKEILAEDRDGQMSLMVKEHSTEPQIHGQMSIEDVLREWERTMRAAEAALELAKQQKLETAKAMALQEAGEIMGRLSDVMPKLDAGMTPSELLKEEYLGELGELGESVAADAGVVSEEDELTETERAGRIVAGMNQILQRQIDRLQAADTTDSKQEEAANSGEHELLRKIRQAKPNFDEQIGLRPYVPEQLEGRLQETVEEELQEENNQEEEISSEQSFAIHGEEADDVTSLAIEMLAAEERRQQSETEQVSEEDAVPEEISESVSDEESESRIIEDNETSPVNEQEEEVEFTEEELAAAEREFAAGPIKGDTTPIPPVTTELPKIPLPEDITEDIAKQDTKDIKSAQITQALEEQLNQEEVQSEPIINQRTITKLSKEQKQLFSYFVPVDGMERQICQVLSGAASRLASGASASTGNIIIQGGKGCGKTVLATAFIKALQREVGYPNGKIGKIEASSLNKKDIQGLLKKVAGGCLIIEKAGELNRETAVKMSLLMETDTSGLLVIVEDTRAGLNKVLALDDGFTKKFTEKVKIPVFTSDELVTFGKAYANDLDYEIDAMGVLALYNRISNIQRLDHATTLTEVKHIVDEAIERAEKKSIKKAFSILTSRRYNEDDYVILHEKDFEE